MITELQARPVLSRGQLHRTTKPAASQRVKGHQRAIETRNKPGRVRTSPPIDLVLCRWVEYVHNRGPQRTLRIFRPRLGPQVVKGSFRRCSKGGVSGSGVVPFLCHDHMLHGLGHTGVSRAASLCSRRWHPSARRPMSPPSIRKSTTSSL